MRYLNRRLQNDLEEYMGKEGEEARNNTRIRVNEMCIEIDIIIKNTMFKHKEVQK